MSMRLLAVLVMVFTVVACSSTGKNAGTAGAGAGEQGGAYTGYNDVISKLQEQMIAETGSDRVLFGYDSSVLNSEAQSTLTRQAAWINRNANASITVEGHCDERGTREYNLALGERRATAVRNYLVSSGVDANRLSVISYGKERPAAIGSNDDAWKQNRRGVVVVN